ncbi:MULTISPECIES: 4-(cytidine 5'-diphospho)-2-C-methyl-D-erythritol kinase [Vibrio]|uniref:4-diphosphocytidyl-2-C-methyl-D-erythritol kinase n=1 Tax=Vibrio casei TaxID=673372 RepID=A0A368LPD3_9VIBR|nr:MULTISPECIES: 4-(cytidine 5'-diphospho)-2-C-methyl-D-erythritol kinase [Vibrio]RCS73681.1 4-(cytidine 5'-diphospho)-2-C-methyl-D-erythritol kinase [Vibrio casei]SJN16277.1 4-diphosphocytidyl-2-C-methyl-D-erythritol kinase [Vibrio casei]HBV75449.1 4-(cytidine 5'-diphospho)-2-C-methyl-D-erythritol kinase [Vibrio sp.]
MPQQIDSFISHIKWPAPAKLNLFLYITGRRTNGYHDLQTLFQFIDHGDTLQFSPNKSGKLTITPEIKGVSLEQNLIWKAAEALRIEAQKTLNIVPSALGVDIQLNKTLPMGGGLGGGSSNAATTLIALNEIWSLNFSINTLANLGLTLGADVPVFVRGHSAFAEGIGEQLIQANPKEKWYLVIKPNVNIATAEIFTHPNLTRNTPKRELSTLLQQPYENDCEKIVTLLYPEVAKQLSWLLQYAPSRLTGTGSCLFAEFDTQQQATSILSKLNKQQNSNSVFGFIAKGVNISPLYKTLADYKQADNNSI